MDPANEPEEKEKKGREPRTPNNSAILLACMGVAFFLWLLIKMSNTYSGQIPAYIRYSNLPGNKVLVKPLDKKVKLRVETTGFKLLLSQMGIEPVYVDIDFQELRNTRYILTEDIKRRVVETLPNDVQLFSISPDTLYLYFDDMVTRKVPVRLNNRLEFEQQFGLKNPVALTPDSVTVSGPKVVMDSIRYWPTVELKQKGVKGNLHGVINLQKPDKNGVAVTPDKVKYNLTIEEYTEQNIEVEVQKLNVPKGMHITTYPRKVKVTFQVALSNYEAVSESSFEAVADFAKIDLHNQKEVYVNLTKWPPYVKNVTVSPQSVEFIIYK